MRSLSTGIKGNKNRCKFDLETNVNVELNNNLLYL